MLDVWRCQSNWFASPPSADIDSVCSMDFGGPEMASKSVTLFPDTNFFLECRDPAECPWSEITDADEITLAVCRAVRSEIDSNKFGRNRVAGRARTWSQRLRLASRGGGRQELRAERPRIVLWMPPPVPPLATLPEVLDTARPDDRVIADILAQKQAHPNLADASFLTDDGGAADTARHVGLSAIDIPLDDESKPNWRLPRELDNSEKKIRDLEARLRSLEGQAPSINIRVADNQNHNVESIPISITSFAPLLPTEIEQLVRQAEAMSPQETDFKREPPAPDAVKPPRHLTMFENFFRTWRPPDEAEIRRYLERDYLVD